MKELRFLILQIGCLLTKNNFFVFLVSNALVKNFLRAYLHITKFPDIIIIVIVFSIVR